MLILTRRHGEAIWIGKDIRVKVLKSSRARIRIEIEAPPDIHILRDELRDKGSAYEEN